MVGVQSVEPVEKLTVEVKEICGIEGTKCHDRSREN